jgi:hypothetical protein
MRNIPLIILFLIINGCNGQEKNNNLKNDKMTHFDISQYKNWEIDADYSSSDSHRFLKKRDERVEIYFHSSGIQIRLKSVNHPYEKIYGYSNTTKSLIEQGTEFYKIPIGKNIQYDEKGDVIKEIDYEKPYKFSIKDLIEKIKKEYGVDLEDRREGASAGRRGKDGVFYYEVNLQSKTEPLKRDYILIDGNTGETLFKSYFYMKSDGGGKIPFDEYLESLKNK